MTYSLILSLRHAGLVVDDLERCLAFYQEALGLKVHSRQDESGPFLDSILVGRNIEVTTIKMAAETGETLLELLCFKSPAGVGGDQRAVYHQFGFTHLALTVSDLDQVRVIVLRAGGQWLSAPQLSADGTVRVAFGRDPEGNLLEFVQKV